MDKPTARRRARATIARWLDDPTTDRSAESAARCRHLDRFLTEAVDASARVVIYDALGDEIDLGPLLAAHRDPTGRYAITRTPDEGYRLTVHPLGGQTERHRHGYDQPAADAPTVADGDIGAVLVPGLAFGPDGRRLGRGAGYYDRFLARLGPAVLRIGIGLVPPVEGVPIEDDDVAMTHLATPDGVVVVSSG